MTAESLKMLTPKEQLIFVEEYLPDAWNLLQGIASTELPRYDDNDEVIREDEKHET